MKILGLVTARGGSKRLPGKNIKQLEGKPLLAYTAEAAIGSGVFDRIILSTDCPEIATVGKNIGLEVPFMRPQILSEDTSSSADVVIHALKVLADEDYKPDLIFILQPTSPLRTAQHIIEAVELFDPDKCDAVYSVCEVACPPWWMWSEREGYLRPFIPPPDGSSTLRHELPLTYESNGAIYLSKVQNYLERKKPGTLRIKPYVMNHFDSVDVDTEFDWFMLEVLLQKRGLETTLRPK